MLQNYRDSFKKRYGAAPFVTDAELEEIIESIGTLSTAAETDEAIMDTIHSVSMENAEGDPS
jgi:hypothetical protein